MFKLELTEDEIRILKLALHIFEDISVIAGNSNPYDSKFYNSLEKKVYDLQP